MSEHETRALLDKLAKSYDRLILRIEALTTERNALLVECEHLRKAVEDLTTGYGTWDREISVPEDAAVLALCERFGYGAVMDSASRQWARKDPQGSFVVGVCRIFARRALAALDSEGKA